MRVARDGNDNSPMLPNPGAVVTGTITVSTKKLELSGQANLVGGFFGKGSFTGTLTWGKEGKVEFTASLSLYPGQIVRGSMTASIDETNTRTRSARPGP